MQFIKTKTSLHEAHVTSADFGDPVCALWFTYRQRLLS